MQAWGWIQLAECKQVIKVSEALDQRSPTFLALGTGFVADNFSMDRGGGKGSGWFKHITFIMHFISIIIPSAPSQIIRHEIRELTYPWFKECNIYFLQETVPD